MVTVVFAVAGLVCLVGFAALWPPGALLLMGLTLLWVASVRAENKRKAVRQ